ncbi:MAG: biotin/lipoyl-containing protein, partial [Flavobacteriales bacterium]
MSQIELLLPKMGESVAEATIIKWVKKEGDALKADEPVIEIATDKVDSEVPSPEDGVLIKCLVKEGDVVQVGQPIAIIGMGGESSVSAASTAAPVASAAPAATPALHVAAAALASPIAVEVAKSGDSGKFFSPLVRSIAKAEGVTMQELESIAGTGQGGRVNKSDLIKYIANRGATKPAAAPSSTAAASDTPAPNVKTNISVGPNDEIIEMDRMRKLI